MKYATEESFVGANAFGKGAANTAYAQYFVGNSYLNPLTDPQVTALHEGLGPVQSKRWCTRPPITWATAVRCRFCTPSTTPRS